MDKLLYVYDYKSLELLKNELLEYSFITLTSLFRNCSTTEYIQDLDISKHAIDLSNFFHDTSNDRYYRGFLEDYIIELMSEFNDIKFTIRVSEIDNFKNMYPFIFDENQIFYCFDEEKGEKVNIDNDSNVNEIYIYGDISDINEGINEGKVLNFSHLVTDFNGINASFNYEKINADEQNYIEISSLIEFLKIRRDQVFIYELILNELTKKNVNYLINEKLLDAVNELFPFIFNDPKKVTTISNVKYASTKPTNGKQDSFLDDIENIMEQLSSKLQGHSEFKKTLKLNLFKFKILNRLGKRKILSIFICGKSGIGKTEFARLLSQIMYPNGKQIKLNFGNYSTEGVLNSLIGSPLGYVGSEEGGELINKVRESESKVILIDEFEKADGKVFNFFYELLEDGKFTDRAGNEHDLNSYIIIFTSNLNANSYHQLIPEPLNSRFDMKYVFQPLIPDEKVHFIKNYSDKLINDLQKEFSIHLNKDMIYEELMDLVENDNLREIRRQIEDLVISDLNLKYTAKYV